MISGGGDGLGGGGNGGGIMRGGGDGGGGGAGKGGYSTKTLEVGEAVDSEQRAAACSSAAGIK